MELWTLVTHGAMRQQRACGFLKKQSPISIGLFLLPFDRLMVYDNIDIILLYYHPRETLVFRKSGSRGMIPLAGSLRV